MKTEAFSCSNGKGSTTPRRSATTRLPIANNYVVLNQILGCEFRCWLTSLSQIHVKNLPAFASLMTGGEIP